jgi:hypothetical protein
MTRCAAACIFALAIAGAVALEASAQLTLSEASAYERAEAYGEPEVERMAWAEEWTAECNRQTPWTFSCWVGAWNAQTECW